MVKSTVQYPLYDLSQHYHPTIYSLSDPNPIAFLSGNQLPNGMAVPAVERTYSNSCTMKVSFSRLYPTWRTQIGASTVRLGVLHWKRTTCTLVDPMIFVAMYGRYHPWQNFWRKGKSFQQETGNLSLV